MGTGFSRIGRWIRCQATVVAAAAIAAAQAPLSPQPATRTAEPPGQIDGRDIVMQVLSAVDRGERPSHIAIRESDLDSAFSRTTGAWLNVAPVADRERRNQVVAAALLFVSYRALDESTPPWTQRRFKVLVERQCSLMRRGMRTEFERRWLMASLALVEWSGDRQFLTGSVQSCNETRDGLCDHLSHVRSRYPNESLIRLVEVSSQPITIASRQPGVLAGQLARARVQPSPSFPASSSVARLEARLNELLADPVIGTDARLRLGVLRYGLNQRRESLDDLARVIATSAHVEERMTAHYVSALIHEADLRPADVTRSFEEAMASAPGTRSIALALATRYYLAGRVDDASSLLDRTFAASPPAFDPLRARYAVWTWYQSFDRLAELFK